MPGAERENALSLHPLQCCQNMHQIPIYSGHRGWAVHAKPQPSATWNQSGFALTWTLSPFLLSLLPRLVKKGSTGASVAAPHNRTSHPKACSGAEAWSSDTQAQSDGRKKTTNPAKSRAAEPWQPPLSSAQLTASWQWQAGAERGYCAPGHREGSELAAAPCRRQGWHRAAGPAPHQHYTQGEASRTKRGTKLLLAEPALLTYSVKKTR